jgi:hypothetical protein
LEVRACKWKRWLPAALVCAALTGCSSGSSGTPPASPSFADCDALYQEVDAFRRAHQEKFISGVEETHAELRAYQDERDRLIREYEAVCGPLDEY